MGDNQNQAPHCHGNQCYAALGLQFVLFPQGADMRFIIVSVGGFHFLWQPVQKKFRVILFVCKSHDTRSRTCDQFKNFNHTITKILSRVKIPEALLLKAIHIATKEAAQNVPAPVTTYTLFRDGAFLTQSIQSDKKFLALAGVKG